MIVIPFSRPKPKAYRKVIRKQTHVTGAECLVRVYVRFPQMSKMDPNTFDIKYFESATYAFQFVVELSKHEYESHRSDLETYISRKAEETNEYSRILKNVLKQEMPGREYNVEVYILKDTPDWLKLHYYETEIEEYVPVQA